MEDTEAKPNELHGKNNQPVLLIISANTEWQAVCQEKAPKQLFLSPYGTWFSEVLANRPIIYFHGGWGKISAAASAEYAFGLWNPCLVINLGTCGGFAGRVEVGEIILAEDTVVYDIMEQMGDPDEALAFYSTLLECSWLPAIPPIPVRRSRLVSADRDILPEDIPRLVEKFGAVAADWESGAIAWVARHRRLPCLILRGVTDLVGATGGEAYGKIELFQQRTTAMMHAMLKSLPEWIDAFPPEGTSSIPGRHKCKEGEIP